MNKLRVFEAFAGYGSQAMALERLARKHPGQFGYEVVGISEIDRYAIQAHRAVHGDHITNYGDIARIDWAQVPDIDLLTYSFPCTNISTAGRQEGLAEGSGTSSSLLWECQRAIEQKRPKFLLMENVKALTQKKFRPEFERWCATLEALGYKNFWQVINATQCNVPQNRERVFMVSIWGGQSYEFPQPQELERRLAHVLEPRVDESFYLSQEQVAKIVAHCERKVSEGCGFKTNFQTKHGISGAIKTKEGSREYDTYIVEPQVIADPRRTFNKIQLSEQSIGVSPTICSTDSRGPHLVILLGYTRDRYGRVTSYHPKLVSNAITTATGSGGNTDQFVAELDAEPRVQCVGNLHPESAWGGQPRNQDRVYGIGGVAPTLNACGGGNREPKILLPPGWGQEVYRVRKLTPREAFRLMDVADADIDRIQAQNISKTQQYKLAGNSIVVACMERIFENLFINPARIVIPPSQPVQLSLFPDL